MLFLILLIIPRVKAVKEDIATPTTPAPTIVFLFCLTTSGTHFEKVSPACFAQLIVDAPTLLMPFRAFLGNVFTKEPIEPIAFFL